MPIGTKPYRRILHGGPTKTVKWLWVPDSWSGKNVHISKKLRPDLCSDTPYFILGTLGLVIQSPKFQPRILEGKKKIGVSNMRNFFAMKRKEANLDHIGPASGGVSW